MVGLVAAGLLVGGLLTTAGAGPAGAAATSAQKAQAKKALLVLHDMPAGWTSSPSSTSNSGNFTGAPQLASCLGVPRQIVEDNPPEVDSPQFANKAGTQQVQDSISIFPSARFAQEEYAAVSSRKAPGCIHTLVNGSLKSSLTGNSGASASSMTVTKVASPHGTTAFDMDTTVATQGLNVPVRLQLVFFVRGQLGDAVELSSYGSSPLPPSLVQHLTALAQSRL
jgi:hypothetical protein